MGALLSGLDENFKNLKNFSENTATYILSGKKQNGVFYLNFESNDLIFNSGVHSCVIEVSDDFEKGNTFHINGASYAIRTTDGETLETGAFVSGSKVPVIVDASSKIICFDSARSKLKLTEEYYGMTDLVAGESRLETGRLYFVYE